MKNKFFLSLLGSFAFAALLQAQTNVTSTYIHNAGFDEAPFQTGNVAASGSPNSKDVTGWVNGGGSNWSSSAAFAFNSGAQINGSTIPEKNYSGTSEGGALGLSVAWTGSSYYTQDVTLQAGTYTLKVVSYNVNTVTTVQNLFGFVPESGTATYGTTTSFKVNDWTVENIVFELAEETSGKISVGIQAYNTGSGSNARLVVDYVELYSGFDMSEINAAISSAEAEKVNYPENSFLNVTLTNELASIKAGLDNIVSIADYNAVVSSIKTAHNTFLSNAKIYDRLAYQVERAKKVGADVTAAESLMVTPSATLADFEAMYGNINVAAFNAANTSYAYPVDLGSWTMSNVGDNAGQYWDGNSETRYYDKWSNTAMTSKMTQSILLPAGDYVLKANGRGNAISLKMMVGDEVVNYIMKGGEGLGINTAGEASFSADATYANGNNGYGWEWQVLPFTVDEEKTVTLSFEAQINNSWFGIGKDIALYCSSAYYITIYERLAKLAEDAITANPSIKGVLLSDLNAALTLPVSDEDTYVAATKAIEAATAAFLNGATAFNKLNTLIASAEAMGVDVTTYSAIVNSDDATVDDIKTSRNNLTVDIYNTVKATYSNDFTSSITNGWTSTMVTNRGGQHWSGDNSAGYFEQSGDKWGLNSWSVGRENTVTLPAGKYVAMLDSRASAAVESYLEVNGVKVYVESNGDTGFGIDITGAANYASDATYCNNNKGRGWSYIFVPFELTEQTDVLIKEQASTNAAYNWVSLGNLVIKAVPSNIVLNETDNETNLSAYDQKAANVTLNRSIKAGFNTICVPFELTVSQLPVNTKLYELTNVNGGSLEFTSVESVSANTPALLYASEAQTSLSLSNVTISAPSAVSTTKVVGDVSFIGTLGMSEVPVGSYFISGDKFYEVDDAAKAIKGYRAYFTPAFASGIKEYSIAIDGVVTAIDAVASESTKVNVYSVDGKLIKSNVNAANALNGMAKGVYVVNGKKVVK